MFKRDPIRSLTSAVRQALRRDLASVDSKLAGDLPSSNHDMRRRPHEDECDVVLFGQVWSGRAIGYTSADADRHFELDTTVVVGPAQDACVYVSTQLLYHVEHPNRHFFLDVAGHSLAAQADAESYEGRDDPITEAVDIEVGSMLARLHAQVKTGEPRQAVLVAQYLHRCAACFESPSHARTATECTAHP